MLRFPQDDKNLMELSQSGSLYLRSTSTVSLDERFSQVLEARLIRPRMETCKPVPRRRRKMVLLLQVRANQSRPSRQAPVASRRMKWRLKRRTSVWARLGWQQLARRLSALRPPGFWSFRNKYTWRARCTSTCCRRGNHQLGRRRFLMAANLRKPPAGRRQPSQQRGGATAARGRRFYRKDVPTKKQLDAQLDEYMSLSRSRLDAQLDEYMSLSRSRLDADLDEYMLMAGQSHRD